MSGIFVDSPDLVGKSYASVADYPHDQPIAQDGARSVYKGIRKVVLVVDGVVADYYDWDIYGSQYYHIQKQAQLAWGINWWIA